ncbi:MAG TPA: flagellar filament capping protein FliD, partial [Blastocatellia bacterium]|nr:flagellar filament capping protein FliD [Blastocatellia bacterium]
TSLAQASRIYTAKTDAVLAGGATEATFELRKGGAGTGTAITINSTNNTLEGLRDAINNAKAGVTAAIVDIDGKGNQFKLVLSSEATGSSGRVELVETSATGTAADLNLVSQNVPGGDLNQLDASLTINGLPITRSSNNISDALTGVTLDLKGTGEATVSVTNNTSAITDKVSAFVDAYNDIQNFIAAQYKADGNGKPTGLLAGDPTLRAVQQQLRDAVGGSSTDNGGSFSNLTQIGIGRDESGKLTLDTTTLNEKLSTSLTDVKALLAGKESGKTGIANSIYESYNKLSDNITGTVQTAIKGYQDTVKSIDKSVADQLDRISRLRETLRRQFAAADAAIGQLNGQGTSLTNIIESLKPKSNK